MSADIRKRIIQAWNQFEDEHDKQPSKLHLTVRDEWDVLKILPKVSEELAQKALIEGVRKAVPKIFGIPVVYRAKKFRFE